MNEDRAWMKDILDRTAVLVLVALCASWGLQQVTIKIANQGVSPVWQSGIRSAGSTVHGPAYARACAGGFGHLSGQSTCRAILT